MFTLPSARTLNVVFRYAVVASAVFSFLSVGIGFFGIPHSSAWAAAFLADTMGPQLDSKTVIATELHHFVYILVSDANALQKTLNDPCNGASPACPVGLGADDARQLAVSAQATLSKMKPGWYAAVRDTYIVTTCLSGIMVVVGFVAFLGRILFTKPVVDVPSGLISVAAFGIAASFLAVAVYKLATSLDADEYAISTVLSPFPAIIGAVGVLIVMSSILFLSMNTLRLEGSDYGQARQTTADVSSAAGVQAYLGGPTLQVHSTNMALAYEANSLERLTGHVGALGSRANFLLVAGLVFSAIDLSWAIISSYNNPDHPDAYDAFVQSLPRLSVVVVVTSVTFFFLRTYLRTLSDIRYIENEITNVEMKFIGLHFALSREYEDVEKDAMRSLLATERNHILEKGQTSLENQRDEIEASAIAASLAPLLSELMTGEHPTKSSEAKPEEPDSKDA